MLLDPETANELMQSFEDHYEVLQSSLNQLMHKTDDADLINLTFRSMHTIKGNAAMMQVTPLVDYSHAVEEAIASVRSGKFHATPTLCDLLLTAVDRLRDLHAKHLFDKEISPIDEAGIAQIFTHMANSQTDEEVAQYCHLLTCIFSPNSDSCQIAASPATNNCGPGLDSISNHNDYLQLTEQQSQSLSFFRNLSLAVDAQNPFWSDRTNLLVYLALRTVAITDKKMDKVQLIAAIYLHDIGMAYVDNAITSKKEKLTPEETQQLQQHPLFGYGLVSRMNGWEEAAQMVLQHHEQLNGGGYPKQTQGDDICEGAKLIAILDAYFAMTHLRADRSHRRSILRAIAEINACVGTQFCAYWVDLFNQVVRQEVKNGTL